MATEFPILIFGHGADTWPGTLVDEVDANLGHIELGTSWWDASHIVQAEKYASEGVQFVLMYGATSPDAWRPVVNYWKDWDNLYGYMVIDEPDRKTYCTPSLITSIHNAITAIDSTRPTIHTNGFGSAFGSNWQDYIGTTNITLFDYYWHQCGMGAEDITTTTSYLTLANTAFGNKSLDIATYQMGVFLQAFKETGCASPHSDLVTIAEYNTIKNHVTGLTGNSVAGDRWGMFALYAAFTGSSGRVYLDSANSTGDSLRAVALDRCTAFKALSGATYPATTGTSYPQADWPARPTPPSGQDNGSGSQRPPPNIGGVNSLNLPRRISLRTGESYKIPISNGTAPFTYTLTGAPSGTQMMEGSIIAGTVSGRADLTVVDSSTPYLSGTAVVSVYDCGCATTN